MISSTLKRLRSRDLRILDRGPNAYLWSSLAHYALRALLPAVRRDQSFVTNEYNHDNRDEYWKPSMTEDEFIYGNAELSSWVLIDHQLRMDTEQRVREHLLPLLRQRVANSSRSGDLVVEFGAGTGRNLAYLAGELPDRRYVGLELTPRSVENARERFGKLGLPIEMRVTDMTKPIEFGTRAAVSFSVLALEQLPNTLSRDAIQQMVAVTSNTIICFEPIRELYPLSIRGIASRLRQRRADYLAGLPGHVRALGLHVAAERRTGLAHNPLNEICELVINVAKEPQ